VTSNVSLPVPPLRSIAGGGLVASSGPAVIVSPALPRLTVTDVVGLAKSVVGLDAVLEMREIRLLAVGSSPSVMLLLTVLEKLNVRIPAASWSKMPLVWLRPV